MSNASPSPDDPRLHQTRRLLHELQVHQVELAQQNEELRRARSELDASLRRYQHLYRAAPIGLLTVDRLGFIVELNQTARDSLCPPGADGLGRPLVELVAPDHQLAVQRALADVAAAGGRPQGTGLLLAVELPGGRRWLQADLRASSGTSGETLVALADVTERLRAESELRHTRELLELSGALLRIGYWEHDCDSGVLTLSARTRELLQLRELPAPVLADLPDRCCDADARDRLQAALDAAAAQDQAFELDLQAGTPAGGWRWVRISGRPERADGRCWRVYGAVQDIEDRVQAEAARLALARAEAASESKSRFLARMSHELRTPLNAVLGFSELLVSNDALRAIPAVGVQLQHIHTAGEHLLAMVDEVLDLARIESGGLRLRLAPVDTAALAQECAEMVRPMARQRGVDVDVQADPAAPPAWADATRLRQVLMNLLGNAAKYNRRGGQVRMTVTGSMTQVVVNVADTGRGMNADQVARLFEPFNRLGAEYGEVEGTGLGLVITRQLLQAMNGTLDVHSTPGVGSVFTASLPRAP